MAEAVIVSAVRTPVGRAPKGALATTRPDDLAATALLGALERVPNLQKNEIDDVSLEDAKSLGSVSGLQYLLEVNACLAQAALHDLAHDRGIVHYKSTYAIHEAAPVFST